MTKSEVIARIKSDALFALGFAIDNNPQGVLDALNERGFNGGNSPKYAFAVLSELLKTDKQKVIDIISNVQYLEDTGNYTAGYKDYFLLTTPPSKTQKSFDFNGLLAGLGVGLGTYAAYSAASGAGAMQTAISPAEVAAAEKKKKEEEEAAKKKKMWTYIGIGSTVLVIIVILVAVFRKGADKKEEDKKD